jgi:anti-sigma factor RsiW
MTVRHPIHLQCREVVELVTDLLDGHLDADDVVRVEQHLLVCPPCTLHVRQVRDTIAIARETRPTTAAPAAALDILRRWKAES